MLAGEDFYFGSGSAGGGLSVVFDGRGGGVTEFSLEDFAKEDGIAEAGLKLESSVILGVSFGIIFLAVEVACLSEGFESGGVIGGERRGRGGGFAQVNVWRAAAVVKARAAARREICDRRRREEVAGMGCIIIPSSAKGDVGGQLPK